MSTEDNNTANLPGPANGPAAHHTETAPEQKPIKGGHGIAAAVVFVLVLVALAVFGILPRLRSEHVLAEHTNELAAPSVIAITPKPGDPIQELILPGNVTSY